MVRLGLVSAVVALWGAPALGHDVSVDVGLSLTTSSDNNPRTGSVSAGASGSVDVSRQVTLFGTGLYTRELSTSSYGTAASGSDIVLLGLGVGWFPSVHWATSLSVTGSPPAVQTSATRVALGFDRVSSVVVSSRTWLVGALWTGSWTSGGLSGLEHTVDVIAGVNRYELTQQAQLGSSVSARLIRQGCQLPVNSTRPVCALVRGDTAPLWQARLAVGYTATVKHRTDVGVEAAYYLYDRDPDAVGLYSVVAPGRVELGTGLPVLPLQLALRPSMTHRAGPVTVRAVYQFGLYRNGNGSNHWLSVKLTLKASAVWRPFVQLVGQLDAVSGGASNPGGQAIAGVLAVFE